MVKRRSLIAAIVATLAMSTATVAHAEGWPYYEDGDGDWYYHEDYERWADRPVVLMEPSPAPVLVIRERPECRKTVREFRDRRGVYRRDRVLICN